jgi:hypothetical protein
MSPDVPARLPSVAAAPCVSCPWRRDTIGRYAFPDLTQYAAGTIPGREDFGAMTVNGETARDDSDPHTPLGTLFVCHKATDTRRLCAGHVAVVGAAHPLVRLAVALGSIDRAALTPAPDWPDLFDSYDDMVDAVGHDETGEPPR